MPYRENDVQSLGELSYEETVTLLALVREIVAADGAVDQGEKVALDRLRIELGDGRFDQALAGAAMAFKDGRSLDELVFAVERTGAREVIYGALFEMAVPSTIHPDELSLLDWLRRAWGFETEGEGG